MSRLLPDWGWNAIHAEIQKMVLAELDYRQEAEAMAEIAKNFAGRTDVLIPRVIAEYSTARVLTTQWMDGLKVGDIAGIEAAGIDRMQAGRLCIEAYCKQIFVDGVYHADPHPGNLLLVPNGNSAAHAGVSRFRRDRAHLAGHAQGHRVLPARAR